MHCCAEVTESSTNKQHHFSIQVGGVFVGAQRCSLVISRFHFRRQTFHIKGLKICVSAASGEDKNAGVVSVVVVLTGQRLRACRKSVMYCGLHVVVQVVALSSQLSAQIRGAVSVHQGSLIRKVCLYVRRACVGVMWCCFDGRRVRLDAVFFQWLRSQDAAVRVNANCVHSSGRQWSGMRGIQAPVRGVCI